jgi:hypothetical protein
MPAAVRLKELSSMPGFQEFVSTRRISPRSGSKKRQARWRATTRRRAAVLEALILGPRQTAVRSVEDHARELRELFIGALSTRVA